MTDKHQERGMNFATPGPWKAGHYSSVVGLPVVAQPDPKQNSIIVCGVRGERDVAEANARLIAESPNLVAALRIADAAINPPDRESISLAEWNKRLKAATTIIRSAISAAGATP